MGIGSDRFWGMTLREIADEMNAAADVEKHRRRLFEHQLYTLAVLINRALLRPQDFPDFDEAYPDPEDQQETKPSWEEVRDRMRSVAAYHNSRR